MFIQTEATPNPDTVKFLPGPPVAGHLGPFDYPDAASARASLLARALFQVDGVARVFLGADFVSISKAPGRDWKHVKPMVLAAIMDHFMAGLPVVEENGGEAGDEITYEGETAEIVAEIKELIETRVRPAVAQDGGDITFRSFDAETGIVHLNMRGACAGCPSSTMTLKSGIENMLRTYVPEVTAVEAVL
ncbi:MAG: NifU family protein [Hyphomonas sp.]|uniref:NifU family protein n=1 Tax=Hyphomonas sp. TaxID=87 RepID=UPI0017B3BA69|nr:NifU family protein [Hyphomonas sp.]MBU4060838.1 NifU family protein [Alphaproteobacteria bacterium]MBU4164822.1 NifU family protein [Alphaproteobacteria bacterium]MBU4569241.1 NifU family protein [Alphaproteobacteria bacterium]